METIEVSSAHAEGERSSGFMEIRSGLDVQVKLFRCQTPCSLLLLADGLLLG